MYLMYRYIYGDLLQKLLIEKCLHREFIFHLGYYILFGGSNLLNTGY